MRIFYSKKFLKSYQKLPKNIKEIYKSKEKVLKENPLDPLLGNHKINIIKLLCFFSYLQNKSYFPVHKLRHLFN
jgi:hypothetical protein